MTEIQVSRLIAAAVAQERREVLEEERQRRIESASRAGVDVRAGLKALSDKSLG